MTRRDDRSTSLTSDVGVLRSGSLDRSLDRVGEPVPRRIECGASLVGRHVKVGELVGSRPRSRGTIMRKLDTRHCIGEHVGINRWQGVNKSDCDEKDQQCADRIRRGSATHSH